MRAQVDGMIFQTSGDQRLITLSIWARIAASDLSTFLVSRTFRRASCASDAFS
jgi:hypothetical protein